MSDTKNGMLRWRISAIVGFSAVALGAFGAHGLKDMLAEADGVDTWKTAALYHLIHAVMLIVLARGGYARAWWAFFVGILLFSGSLYALALTKLAFLGPITPFGGLAFLIGWGLLAFGKGSGRLN